MNKVNYVVSVRKDLILISPPGSRRSEYEKLDRSLKWIHPIIRISCLQFTSTHKLPQG